MKATKINNITIELEFDSIEQRKKMASLLSYDVPGAKYTSSYLSGVWDGKKCFLTSKNRVRAGLFKSIFPEHSSVFDKSFVDISFDDIPLFKKKPELEQREYQLKAINTILKNKILLVQAIMGAGKSLIAAGVCSYHLSLNPSNKILFIVYDKNILHQTIDNFKKYGFKVSQFGDGVKDLTGDVIVAIINSLNNIEKPKLILKNISFVFCDEAHHSGSKISKDVIHKIPNCQYFVGLTATPHVKRSIETAELMSVLGPVCFEYGFSKAIKDKKVSPVKAFFLDVDPDWDIKEQVFTRKNYKYIWDTAIQNNTTRNNLIANILNYCVDLLDTTSIVLIDRVEHGASLINSLQNKPKLHALASFGNDDINMRESKKARLQKDGAESINTLVSTVIKEGVDFKVSPVVAMNASGRKNFISLIQFLGRITRPNKRFKTFRIYLDFIDTYHPFLKAHSYERIKACEDFGVTVVICNSVKDLMLEIIKYYKECMKSEVSSK